MTSIAVVKARAKHKQIYAEKDRILNAFASDPSSTYRAVTKVVKVILINGPYLLHGRYHEIKAKSLGAGVYELSTELKNG